MYHHFFGLRKEPFGMTPDPDFLFLTAAHREALAGLTYSILTRKGFVVLTGDAGTGKTTLLTRIFQSIPSARVCFSMILNPTLTTAEFLELALLDFGVAEVPASKAQRLSLLQQFLLTVSERKQTAVLVVDEAHKLPPDVLEEIRLLSNFEQADAKLLQIVLAGQTELGDVLNRQDMRQLKQRIAVRLAIHPLAARDVEQYIEHRWRQAGGTESHPFERAAVAGIAKYSRGIPRVVNVLCDNALMLAYGEGVATVGARQVEDAVFDLDLVAMPLSVASAARAPQPPGLEPMDTPAPANGNKRGNGHAPFPTLDRYETPGSRPSTLTRLAGKLGLTGKPA